jgi:predicted enzyme related to lactoylglutathione lyase
VGERERYEPGTFCWIDLGTDDAPAATAFYTAVFGWEADDLPRDAGPYTMFHVGGRRVAALYGRTGGEAGPPAWLSYVSVDDVDAVAARAVEGGGRVVKEPFDVFDSGRKAVIDDPTGAQFAVWRPGEHVGAELVNGPGLWCLNQLNTSDPVAAEAFYTEVFGWRFQSVGPEETPYWGIFNGDNLNGGMMPDTLSHWVPYFGTADTDATAARITQLGGRVVVPPMDIPPAGRIAVALDPQGAPFALFAGRFDA